jgi:hypothetical protein
MSNPEPRAGRAAASALALLLSCGALAGEAPDYRLAGIVEVGPERWLAVIEMPDGRQGLFRAGETLGEGRIVDVARTGVRVELGGEIVLLSLRGNPSLSAAVPITGEDAYAAEGSPRDPSVRSQPLFYEDTVKLLTSVARATAAATPGHTTSPPAGADAGALSARLGELLGVPAGARIVAVDRDAVKTPQEVIDAVVPRLGAGQAVRLSLAGAGDLEVLYLTPVEEDLP